MKKKTKKLTQSSLAAALGVTRQLIASHRRKPDAPALNNLPGWTAYLAQKGRIGSAPPDLRKAIAQERLNILRETKTKLKRENEIKSGQTMLAADARAQAIQAMALTFAELQRLASEWPPALAGLDAVSIYERIHAGIESLRATLTKKFESIGK